MEYKSEFDINTFGFWAGARDRMNEATPEQREAIDERLQELYEDTGDIPTETDINDIVWFECDDIFYPEEEEEEELDEDMEEEEEHDEDEQDAPTVSDAAETARDAVGGANDVHVADTPVEER